MKSEVALVVIYNHRFDQNIEVVERVYRDRFSNIFHLVPFYTGVKPNVIAVYENSHYFQGYVAQGFKHFIGSFKHYFFIADDMIVNPTITQANYADVFRIGDGCGFLPELDSMPEGRWMHDRAAVTYDPFKPGVEIKTEIPAAVEAAKIIAALGVRNDRYLARQTYFWDDDFSLKNIARQALRYAHDRWLLRTDPTRSKYPFIRSYSDIFIVSAANIRQFAHYCGAFAATDLWVELAIPTALALTGEKISTQAGMALQGRPLWSAQDMEVLQPFNFNLKKLLTNFPPNYIYLHPVKLSKWQVDF